MTVANQGLPGVGQAAGAASIGPRPGDRGEHGLVELLGVGPALASIGPRPGDRGELSRTPSGYTAITQLQLGHDLGIVENIALFHPPLTPKADFNWATT